MACPNCGSGAVRADRSLAGRLVCGRCGTPLQGAGRRSGQRRRGAAGPQGRHRGPGPWVVALVAGLVVALAALQRPGAAPGRSDPDAGLPRVPGRGPWP